VSPPRLAARKLKTWAQRLASVTGWFGGCAVVLVSVGVLAVCTEVLSPTFLLWTGHAVPGLDLGGTVNYQYHGVSYTFEAHDRPQGAPPQKVTVYLDPSDPVIAAEDRLSTRLFDATFVLAPFLAAAASLAMGWRRWRRAQRRSAAKDAREGYGFGPGELRGHH
jgi:hypothetical protein